MKTAFKTAMSLALGIIWVVSCETSAAAQQMQPLSENDMQSMLNEMNAWKHPTGGYGAPPQMGGMPGGYGAPSQMGGMQGGYGAPSQMGGMQGGYGAPSQMGGMQGGYGAPSQMGMQQMPMPQNFGAQGTGGPINSYPQLPPMQGVQAQSMNAPSMPPMAMPQQMISTAGGAAQMPPLQGMAAQQAGIGSRFNLGNIFGKPLIGPGGMGNIFRQMAALNQSSNSGSGSANARDAIEYELSLAKSMAAQAVAYMDDARSARERGAKQSAAAESRYYANEARAAADRAASRLSECPDAAGLVSAARAEANRAYSASQYAADAASGW